jgi:KaiC/GvpD/RAD55 family RecA-like ATPase
MSRELRLPLELDSFIARPGPLTMVVRGPPGSGKTTLALAMLEAFYGRKIFVTGRRDKAGVLADFPWLGSVDGHAIEVVDAVVNEETGREEAVEEAGEQAVQDEAALSTVIEALPPPFRKAWGRRGSPVRDLVRDFAWMPKGLRGALAHALSGQRAMIVIDSWDAFVEECLDLAPAGTGSRMSREEIERGALRLISKGSAHLVLILEREQESQLDYLVDGIVRTSHEVRDTHPERWISLPKLRGVRIDSETYPYTLEGGRFKCVSAQPPQFRHPAVFAEPDPEPLPGTVWPGSRSFAEAFGRLRGGELSIIESDDEIADSGVETLIFPIIASVLREGGRVLYEPPPAHRLDDLWEAFRNIVTPGQVQELIRIVAPGATLPEGHPLRSCLLSVPRAPEGPMSKIPMNSQTPKARDFITTVPASGATNVSIFAADNLRLVAGLSGTPYTPESLTVIAKTYVVGSPAHLVFLVRTGDPLLEGIRTMATVRLLLRNRVGRMFIYGQRPVTPAYSLAPRHEGEERAYSLLRLV